MTQKSIINAMSELRELLDLEIAKQNQKNEYWEIQSGELAQLGIRLNERRKALRLDIQSLEWQTGISSSTLKRIFKDPSQVKFISVVLLAETLGVKLCFAK